MTDGQHDRAGAAAGHADGSEAGGHRATSGLVHVRRAEERGHADHGWLDTYHTFSFAHYHDPAWMGHRNLRVLNQDRIQGGTGFGAHRHRDMEIVSYVLEGALRHRDDLGNAHVIRPGEVQRMTAGTGVTHEEWNDLDTPTSFLQMWVLPARQGLQPSYDQRRFDLDVTDRLVPVAVPEDSAENDGAEGGAGGAVPPGPDGGADAGSPGPTGPVRLHADAHLFAGRPRTGAVLHHGMRRGHGWLHVARGEVHVAGHRLKAGDGAALRGPVELRLDVAQDADLVLWELP